MKRHNPSKCDVCKRGDVCPLKNFELPRTIYADMPGLKSPEVLDRDREFGMQLDESRSFLLRQAHMMTHDPAAAEDLVQEACLRAYAARDSFEDGTNIRAWLSCIQRNIFINHKNRESRNPAYGFTAVGDELLLEAVADEETHATLSPEKTFFDSHIDPELKQAVSTLSEKLRVPFVLHVYGGYQLREIARMHRLSVGTVKSRIFRAKEALRTQLEKVVV